MRLSRIPGRVTAQVRTQDHDATRGLLNAALLGALVWSLIGALGWVLI